MLKQWRDEQDEQQTELAPSFLARKDGLIAQMVVLLLETEPEPGKGYYGIAIEAAETAYRIKKEQEQTDG